MKTIVVAAMKGGAAKTTTAEALAAELAERGHAVLYADADPQASSTLTFGVAPAAMPWIAEPIELYLKDLLAGSITLIRGGRPLRAATSAQLEAFFTRENVTADYMVIDTPPGDIEIVEAAIEVADLLLVPVDTSPRAILGMNEVIKLARNYSPPPQICTLLTRVDNRRRISREMAERIDTLHPGTRVSTAIPENAAVNEAPDYGMPVTLYDRSSAASQAYGRLTDEILERLAHPEPLAHAGGARG